MQGLDGQEKKKLTQAQLNFMKEIERKNLERVQKLQRIKKNNILLGVTIGASVLGIYGYSIYSVRQEKFLDDFNEPVKVSQ